jgi:hypothetical protein
LGGFLHSGPEVTRENRSRRNLHGNEEEGKKKETLTVCETILRKGQDFKPASQEKHLLRGVSVLQQLAAGNWHFGWIPPNPILERLTANWQLQTTSRKILHRDPRAVSQL